MCAMKSECRRSYIQHDTHKILFVDSSPEKGFLVHSRSYSASARDSRKNKAGKLLLCESKTEHNADKNKSILLRLHIYMSTLKL
jgi:hypothetical protein